MKKILTILIIGLALSGCGTPGETHNYPVKLKIHGKVYKNEYIHVIYPEDTKDTLTVDLPQQIIQQVSDRDDGTKNETVVELK